MKNYKLGGILTILAALIGIIGHFILFSQWYQIGMHAESAEPGCEILLKYIHPFLTDLGLLAAALFAVSAYGYFTKKNWASMLAVLGIILALLGSFFVNIPFMAADLPPVYMSLFVPYLLFYFALCLMVEKISWRRTMVGLATGIAYIFCWMNGVSSTSRIITHGTDIFVLVQRLHWIAMLGWAVVTAVILLKPKSWILPIVMTAALVELIVGIPLTIVTMQDLDRFSMFALAPIASLGLLILFLIPGFWKKWVEISK
jgi:NADH:ubiquinone oxidoreductase subunit K